LALDDAAGSLDAAREAIATFAFEDPGHFYVTTAIESIALTYALGGDPDRGARLRGYVNAAHERVGSKRGFIEKSIDERLVGELARASRPAA
jgi:hypothetical protein